MKRNWTLSKATSTLLSNGAEVVDTLKKVVIFKSVKGLKACSAMDYLSKHHEYLVLPLRNF